MDLAGVPSTAALAEAINQSGMSKGTLDRIARDLRAIKAHEAEWIGDATRLPASFFLADDPVPQALDSAEDRLVTILKAVEALLESQNGLLARQSKILERIESAIEAEDESARRLAADGDAWADQVIARIEAQRPEPRTPAPKRKVPAKSGTRQG